MRNLLHLAMALLAGTASAQSLMPIPFALDWRYEGPAAPYFVAIDKGYYKDEGLEVTVDPGSGSAERSIASPRAPMRWGSPTSTRW